MHTDIHTNINYYLNTFFVMRAYRIYRCFMTLKSILLCTSNGIPYLQNLEHLKLVFLFILILISMTNYVTTNLDDPILSTGHNTKLFVWIRKSEIVDTPSMSFNLNHKN